MKTQQSPRLAAPLENDVDLAIVGMACRFPGARKVEEFWKNLADGVESITRLSDEELLRSGVSQSLLDNPNYVKAASILDGPGFFDAAFFGFSPAEARAMDPQHRILLELAYEALENAGCDSDRFSGRVGVFTGSAMNTYFMNSGLSNRFAEDYIPTLIVNDKDFLSTRISYKLNLKGPSITVQTACSTSLVAVHLARQSLLSGETDMALAGAISVRVPHYAGYFCDGGGVVSPDGRVRAFDANANGTVFGSGGGMIVLKRLADAIASGDTIHAVIKGSAVNNDGCEKAGYTAPSVNSQADAVLEALGNAGIDAESIGYIEAHGSGTPVGDPIEIAALTKAFRAFTQRSGYCAIGSVKTNVGHLDAAAGIASVIKTVLALKHRQLPPSLHYDQPNPEIDFCSTPFFVNTELVPWKSNGPRRAGVMSTGMGGTNAHVVLEEAPALKETASSAMPDLLVLSAKSATALDAATNHLLEFLSSNAAVKIEDVAYTLQTGRKAFSHRRALICVDREDAIVALGREKSKRTVSSHSDESTRRPIVFLLPGVGDHYVGMGRDLYEKWEVFRDEVDRCAAFLQAHLDVDLREIIYPNGCQEKKEAKSKGIDLKKMLGQTSEPEDPATRKLNQTIYAQPILFTIEYALARFWEHLGIVPDAIVGHSMGEYAAACLAGVFSLEDALWLIAQRAKRANELPQGAMLAVLLSEAEIRPLLGEQLSISLINGPNLCVVAGPVAAVAEFDRTLNERGIISRPVKNAHAFHSRMLDPIVPAFAEDVRKVHLHEPKIPFISNVTGKWITKEDATDPQYWAKHLNRTARFSDALEQMWQFKDAILLEVGPGKTLAVLASQHPDRRNAGDPVTISSLRHHYENQADVEFLYHSIAKLWLSGIDVTWENFPRAEQRRKIPLPTYPFERQNYWLETIRVSNSASAKEVSIHKDPDLSRWFYVPSWKRILPKAIGIRELSTKPKQKWIVFSDGADLTSRIVDRLTATGQQVVTVKTGGAYQELDCNNFVLEADNTNDYELLIQTLFANDRIPDHIIHACNFSRLSSKLSGSDAFRHVQGPAFYSLIFLVRALVKQGFTNCLNLFVLSDQIQEVHGKEALSPEKSTVLGPCMVIPQEYPNIRAKSIDLELASQASIDDLAIDQIFGEFFSSDSELFVAYRNGQRWVRTYEPVQLERPTTDRAAFRAGGVYVITGGLGNIGYEISKYLAKNYQAKLILVGLAQLPKRKLWDAWIDNHSADDPIANRIKKLREIEDLGGDVVYLTANVHDIESMRGALHQAQQRFGNLHAVIHAAGITGEQRFREIKDIDLDHGNAYFQVKAHALLVLEGLLQDKKMDFVLLVSSLTSVLGGIGHAAYTSSCIYLDSFAQKRGRDLAVPWLSVNWDFWRTGDRTEAKSSLGKTTRELGMSADEAMQVLETTLAARRASQLIVSTGDLNARINQWVKLESLRTGRDSTEPGPIRSTFAPRPGSLKNYDEPQNETERRIAAIWQQAFGFDQIGIHDDFSDLGGHSLLAIKIVSELRKTFQINLPIRALFEAPTVAELSSYIETQRGRMDQTCVPNNGATDVPELEDLRARMQKERPELLVEDAFFVPNWFIQQGTWLEDPWNSDSAVYNYPLLLRIRGPLNQTALEQSLAEIVRRHQVFRSIFRMCHGELVQIILPPQKQDLPLTDLSGLPEAERNARFQKIALEEANRPFDLARGPLLRAGLTRFTNDDHFLQLTTHQIVYDDWSTGILARELSDYYQSFATGRARLLPDLTFHYSDYVRWQQKQRRDGKLDSKLRYWKRQLSSAKAFHHLPTDFARPQKSTKQGARESAVVPSDLADALKGLSRRERVSLFMVMLAGFQCLLHRYSKDEEIGIASCGANRALTDVEPLIGRFGNAMLLRTSFSGNPTFGDLLARVRETALTAYSGQDLPFGMLLKETASAAGRNGIPPFQVMFILQNASQDDPQVPGVTMNWHQFFAGTAAYDLDVWLKSEPAVEIILEYRTNLFRAATVKQILNDYHVILETMANDPSTRISDVRLSRKREELSMPIVPGAKKIMVAKQSTTPRNDVELQLIAIWEAALKIRPIDIDQNFFELGGDSLLAARLFAQMEKAFQTDLPLAMLLEAPTIRQLAKTINERKIHPSHSSLVTIQSSGTKPPLFCVHGHMGEVFFCRNLSRTLGTDQPVLGLRSQGLGGENPYHSVEDMAIHYLREIRTRQRNGPYFLCGYCLGGMVAYEVARILRTQGEGVALLVLFNAPAPGSLKGWPLNRTYLRKRIAHELTKLRKLPVRKKLIVFASKAAGLGSLVSGVFKSALWRALPQSAEGRAKKLLSVADINVSAAKAYYPPSYDDKVTLFLTREAPSLYAIDPRDGWRRLAKNGIEVHTVAGDNNSMFDARFINSLAEKLQSCIANAHERCRPSAPRLVASDPDRFIENARLVPTQST